MSTKFNRRDLIAGTAAAGAAACLAGAAEKTTAAAGTQQVPDATAASVRPTTKAAVEWPIWDSGEETALLDVLNSGKWGRHQWRTSPERVRSGVCRKDASSPLHRDLFGHNGPPDRAGRTRHWSRR